jgi:hypothetical protein
MAKLMESELDQKILLHILLDVYQKGEQLDTMDTRDIVDDIVFQLKPFIERMGNYD